jgi:autoinducer 2-degrading protein
VTDERVAESRPMTRFALLVTIRVRPDAVEDFRARILAAAATAEREEPGCLRFEVAQDESEPATFVLIEVYTDAAALAHHHATPHFLRFQEETRDVVLAKTRQRLVLHGG